MSVLLVKDMNHGFGDRAIFEDVSFKEGMSKYNRDPNKTIDYYSKDSDNIKVDSDVDAAMISKQSLEAEIESAIKRNDVDTANALKARLRDLRMSIREAATRGGQFINAFKKWACNDYDSVEIVSYDMLDQRAEKYANKNPKSRAKANNLASEIKSTLEPLRAEYAKATKSGDNVSANEIKNRMLMEIRNKVDDSALAEKLTQYVLDGNQL